MADDDHHAAGAGAAAFVVEPDGPVQIVDHAEYAENSRKCRNSFVSELTEIYSQNCALDSDHRLIERGVIQTHTVGWL